MCFSAIIQQRAKKLGVLFAARIQTDDYTELFVRRMEGEKLLLGVGLEMDFLEGAKTESEKRGRDAILTWHRDEAERLREEILKQVARRDDSRTKLAVKTTKKAENDLRVSLNKIEKLTSELARHEGILDAVADKDGEKKIVDFDRVFPRAFTSMVGTDRDGEKIVIPVRYLLRPHDKDENFDLKFHGCYNARRDALYNVPWWRNLLGQRHGVLSVRNFYEFVPRETYPDRPKSEPGPENLEVEFTPESEEILYVPTLWDTWKDKTGKSMNSAALITDTPLPDVARTGHDRTPIFLTKKAAEEWLELKTDDPAKVNAVLDQKTLPKLRHRLSGS
ncbi:MAG: SOS response-associated peptidase family protein [Bdellovibrionaceae bacterium]|nr:SOS response-associated peptidase family protein [Pseudobdellovibrionaceae bacterium]